MAAPRHFYIGLRAVYAVIVLCVVLSSAAKTQTAVSGGRALFEKRCGGCHALDRDKEGPRLGGVYGRAAGSVPDFQYSQALRKSGITWNAEALDRWLADPDKLAPGNDMSFQVEQSGDRRQIIEYLRQSSGR
jgi:cytochrome c